MSNQPIQTVDTSNDKFKIALAVVALVAGIIAFYFLAGQAKYVRFSALAGGVVVAILFLLISELGKNGVLFIKESVREAKKVVWPTRKEAGQMTAIVFVFVLIMALFLWGADSVIEYVLMKLLLGIGK